MIQSNQILKIFYFLNYRQTKVNKNTCNTLVGPTLKNLIPHPLVALILNNQLWIINTSVSYLVARKNVDDTTIPEQVCSITGHTMLGTV